MKRSLDWNPVEFFEVPLAKIHDAALALARLSRPVVGATRGFASGAGINLALCCDLLICDAETRFNQAFLKNVNLNFAAPFLRRRRASHSCFTSLMKVLLFLYLNSPALGSMMR